MQSRTLYILDAFELFNTARVLGLAAGYPDRDMVSADIEHTEVAHALADGLFSSLPSSKVSYRLFLIFALNFKYGSIFYICFVRPPKYMIILFLFILS